MILQVLYGEFINSFSAKVSLMLDNPFLVPFLIEPYSVCFIQISTKSPVNSYSLQGKQCFLWNHPRCLGPLSKFQHNKDFYRDGPYFQTICFLWLCFKLKETFSLFVTLACEKNNGTRWPGYLSLIFEGNEKIAACASFKSCFESWFCLP